MPLWLINWWMGLKLTNVRKRAPEGHLEQGALSSKLMSLLAAGLDYVQIIFV